MQLKASEFRLLAAKKAARRNKFNAKRTTVADGTTYHSKAEADHCEGLKLLQRAGEISGLSLQPRYPLIVNDIEIGEYIADASYVEVSTGQTHVIDVKGGNATKTPEYKLKRKLMLALYGIDVEEIET